MIIIADYSTLSPWTTFRATKKELGYLHDLASFTCLCLYAREYFEQFSSCRRIFQLCMNSVMMKELHYKPLLDLSLLPLMACVMEVLMEFKLATHRDYGVLFVHFVISLLYSIG